MVYCTRYEAEFSLYFIRELVHLLAWPMEGCSAFGYSAQAIGFGHSISQARWLVLGSVVWFI